MKTKKTMKTKIAFLFLLLGATFLQPAYSQDDKTVTLSVSGQGKTQDEAKQNALRNALEQAFGTFISSKTDIFNDVLVREEIVSISSGNIQKFEVISEVQMPDGSYAVTLKATVSVTKLTSFAETKGVEVEFKGSLFAFNVNQIILNEKNELKAVEDLCKVIKTLADVAFNYTIKVSDPKTSDGGNMNWTIPMTINAYPNKNFFNIAEYMFNTLKGLTLSFDEANNYVKLGKRIHPICYAASDDKYDYFILRNSRSIELLINQVSYFSKAVLNFTITNGNSEFNILNYKGVVSIGKHFHPIIKMDNYGSADETYCSPCLFNKSCDLARCYRRNPVEGYSAYRVSIITQPRYNYTDHKNTIDFFINQFNFVKMLKSNFITDLYINDNAPIIGLVISFSEIKLHNEVVQFNCEDVRTIDEINKITGYKILAGVTKND